MKNHARFILFCLLTALYLSGCTTYHYADLQQVDADKYMNTQAGYHKLSDHFSINVDRRLTKVYYLTGDKKQKQLIATVRTIWFEFSDYGPREIVYAISGDGRRLLFFNEPDVAGGAPDNLKNGVAVADLYLLDASDDRPVLLYKDVHRLGVSCVEFPPNFIRFGKVLPAGEIQAIAFSTESIAVSLDDRRKSLYKRGNKAAVCGPL